MTDGTDGLGKGLNTLAARDKTWPERDRDEKLEALRNHIEHLTIVMHSQARRLARLEQHDHIAGRIVTALQGESCFGGPHDYEFHAMPTALRRKA